MRYEAERIPKGERAPAGMRREAAKQRSRASPEGRAGTRRHEAASGEAAPHERSRGRRPSG
ncbi:hypothetical protein, partial [Paenibacillus forsythiae]|uniref:hypothetical protein n=1 Tax=Paenibacillus forsythiae TaxID=365616 RepID=UPI0012EC92E1